MQHNRGIYFEKGTMEGCYILFQHNSRGFSIGTEECDGPDLILNSTEYVYLCISGAHSGSDHDYWVIEDFDGPIKPRHSGYVYDFGSLRIRLL